jgi:hypothetical protein
MGFQIGDLVQFDFRWDAFPDSVAVTVFGLVTSRTLHKTASDLLQKDPAFDRVERLELVVTYVPRTNQQLRNFESALRHAAAHAKKPVTWDTTANSLVDLLPGITHFHAYLQHNPLIITTEWIKLTNSSLPVEWNELFNLTDNALPLLYSSAPHLETVPAVSAQPGAATVPSSATQELSVGQDRVDLTPFWLLLQCSEAAATCLG